MICETSKKFIVKKGNIDTVQTMKQKKYNIVQYIAYFPPHHWWLEKNAESFWEHRVKHNFWNVINIVSSIWLENYMLNNDDIILWKKNNPIWFKNKWFTVLVVPSIEIITNYPIPKFWKRDFWEIITLWLSFKPDIIHTHTRFFIFTFIGGIIAKLKWIKRLHTEYWSGYVDTWNIFFNVLSKIYDRTIWGFFVFNFCTYRVSVSNACKNFMKKFIMHQHTIHTIYRNISLWTAYQNINKNATNELIQFNWKIIIWYIGRLIKRKNVDNLIKAYYRLTDTIKNQVQLVIVGDGHELKSLKLMDSDKKVMFTWGVSFEESIMLQSKFDIHVHTSSIWWWLANTLLQAMELGCLIIATPYEGADEVIQNYKNGILLKDDSVLSLQEWLEEWLQSLDKKEVRSQQNKTIIAKKFNRTTTIQSYYDIIQQ